VDNISSTYHREDSNKITKECLALLYSIWGLITGTKDLAKEWEEESRRKKRKRYQDDDVSQ